jgi:tripartite-type tricarboxylate transporter receptor subunit TctC
MQMGAAATALSVTSRSASAVDYPTRPIRIVVGFPSGFTPDIFARLMGQWLSERLGQAVVVENKPGAATNLAAEAVVRAPPDGYTLLLAVSSSAVNSLLHSNLSFDFVRDLAPVGFVAGVPFAIVVNPALPVTTIPELIAYSKANPGKINMASPGVGTGPHLSAELFKMMTGADWVHVPYRGNYSADLLSGQIQLSFESIPQTVGYVRDGKLRALAVTSARRSEALPNVPTVGDSVSGYEASGWDGIWAPKNTPTEIISKLNAEIRAGLVDSKLKSRFLDLGAQPQPMTSAEFGAYVIAQTEKWGKVIKFANIKLD